MEKKLILEIDSYEQGILINALNDLRTKQLREGRPTDPVDELIVKIYDAKRRRFLVAEDKAHEHYR